MKRHFLLLLLLAVCVRGETKAIEFAVSSPGFVSLAVYDRDGRMVRPLITGKHHKAGAYQVEWDGLDSQGRAVKPGAYEWRLLINPGFRARYITTVGINPGWTKGNSKHSPWVGNHDQPKIVECDGRGDVFFASSMGENVDTILKQSEDGKTLRWSQIEPAQAGRPRVQDLAVDQRCLLVLFNDGSVVALNKSTGAISWARKVVASRAVQLFPDRSEQKGGLGRIAIAAGAKFFVAAAERADQVRACSYSMKSGRISAVKTLKAFQLKNPLDVATAAGDSFFVLTGDGVYAVKDLSAQPRKIISLDARLKAPYRLAFDGVNNNLLIAQNSNNSPFRSDQAGAVHNVLRYSESGKFRKAYGPKTGRRFQGKYDGNEFSYIEDIAADSKGGFVVCEGYPRRYARFSADGKLMAEWFGGMSYFTNIALDPKDPTVGICQMDLANLGRVKLDPKKGTWKFTHIYAMPKGYGTFHHRQHGLFPGFIELTQIRHFNGRRYLVSPGRRGFHLFLIDDEQSVLKPLACIVSGHHLVTRSKKHIPDTLLAALQRYAGGRNKKLYGGKVYWADRNEDGEFQADEISAGGVPFNISRQSLDAEMNLRWTQLSSKSAALYVAKNLQPGAVVPQWDLAAATKTTLELPPESRSWEACSMTSFQIDGDGSIYGLVRANAHPQDDRQGTGWPTGQSGTSRVLKWNKDGKLFAVTGQHALFLASMRSVEQRAREKGKFAEPMQCSALLGDYVIFQDRTPPIFHAYTKDGLFAGNLFETKVEDSLPYSVYYSFTRHKGPNLGDVQVSNVIGIDGKRAIVSLSGKNSSPVYQVQLPRLIRKRGTLRLATSSSGAVLQGKGLQAEYYGTNNLSGTPVLKRVDRQLRFGTWYGDHLQNLGYTWGWQEQKRRGKVKQVKLPFDPKNFSCRWSGSLEPRFSEDYRFYVVVSGDSRKKTGDRIRLWVDGKLLIDRWDEIKLAAVDRRSRYIFGKSVKLQAGKRVAIKIEYAAAGADSHIHLNWQSKSQGPQHVPSRSLYPR